MKPVIEKHKPLVQLETWGEQLPVMLSFLNQSATNSYHLNNGKLVSTEKLSPDEIASSDILFVPAERMKIVERFLA